MDNEKNFEVQSVLAKAIKRAGEIHNNDKLKKQAEEMEKRIREHKKKKFKVLQTGSKAKSYKSWNIGKWKHSLYYKNNNVILQVKAGNEEAGFPGEIIKFSKSFNSNEEAKNFAKSFSKIPFWKAETKGFKKEEQILID